MTLKRKLLHVLIDAIVLIPIVAIVLIATGSSLAGAVAGVVVGGYGMWNFSQGAESMTGDDT